MRRWANMPQNTFARFKLLKRSYTLLIIPPRGAETRSVRLPYWLLGISGILVVLLVLAVVVGCVNYYQGREERAELGRLRSLTRRQQENLAELQKKARSAEKYLQDVSELERRIWEKAGIQQSGGYTSRAGSDSAARLRISLIGASRGDEGTDAGEVGSALEATIHDAIKMRDSLLRLEDDLAARMQFLEAFPDTMPVAGEISSCFGYRQSPFGRRRSEFHDGLDLAASYGTPVGAAGEGEVVFAGYRQGYGRTVEISHGYRYRSSYSHLSRILVKTGERVQKGEAIGLVGSSGRSTGPHLHFMVEKDGILIDPLTVLGKTLH